jgi:SET domain-containing protein
VRVGESKISGAGGGLFAVRDFPKRTIITEYDGTLISHADAKTRRAANPKDASHMRSVDPLHVVVDGLRTPETGRGGGSFANHSDNPNAKFKKDDRPSGLGGSLTALGRMFLVALQDVQSGDEITVKYGTGYWNSQ